LDSAEEDAPKAKPRKRLIKKSAHESSPDEQEQSNKRKNKDKDGASGQPRKKRKSKEEGDGREKKSKSKSGSKVGRISKSGGKSESSRSNRGDTEMKEMWDSIAGADSEVSFCFARLL
jgi:hypothetical protein